MCRFRSACLCFSVGVLLIWCACQGPTSSRDELPTTLHTGEITLPDPVCYLYVHDRDSVKLRFTLDQDSIEGEMHFKNYQIDGSQGTIRGQFRGDTLFVLYDFFAEGTHSIAEEAFLKRNNTLVRGFGERDEIKGIYRFRDRGDIDFSAGQVFRPILCTDMSGD